MSILTQSGVIMVVAGNRQVCNATDKREILLLVKNKRLGFVIEHCVHTRACQYPLPSLVVTVVDPNHILVSPKYGFPAT